MFEVFGQMFCFFRDIFLFLLLFLDVFLCFLHKNILKKWWILCILKEYSLWHFEVFFFYLMLLVFVWWTSIITCWFISTGICILGFFKKTNPAIIGFRVNIVLPRIPRWKVPGSQHMSRNVDIIIANPKFDVWPLKLL